MKKIFISILLVSGILILSKCKKDEIPPDYAGEWYIEYTALMDTIIVNVKQIYILSKDKYTETYQLLFNDNIYHTIEEYKGKLVVEEDMMTMTASEYGVANINTLTGLPTKELTYYKEGDSEFVNRFPNLASRTHKVVFSIASDKKSLFHYYDLNQDGDYNDQGEIDEFQKI